MPFFQSHSHRRLIRITDKNFQLFYLLYHDTLELIGLAVGVFLLFLLLILQFITGRVGHQLWSESLFYHLPLLLLLILILIGYRALLRSHRIAGPFVRIRRELNQIRQGDLSGCLTLRKKDRLQGLADDFRAMQEGIRNLALTDRQRTEEAILRLEQLRVEIQTGDLSADQRHRLERLMDSLQTTLNSVGSHYVLTSPDPSKEN